MNSNLFNIALGLIEPKAITTQDKNKDILIKMDIIIESDDSTNNKPQKIISSANKIKDKKITWSL